MVLPIHPTFAPMEARSVKTIPFGPEWQYEPKWDGFRCLVFRDGRKIELQSKSGRLLTRYFPELVDAFRTLDPKQFVLDGEIVVPMDRGFSFDAVLQRIHPAPSRIARLAVETPAMFIAFDLLVDSKEKSLTDRPLLERRDRLEYFFRSYCCANSRLRLSRVASTVGDAKEWLRRTGGTLDGVIAKRRDVAYRSDDRTGMQKIKNYRSADCVVGGFRYNEGKAVVGSLLLGLYDGDPAKRHAGADSKAQTPHFASRFYRQHSGRPQPLVKWTVP